MDELTERLEKARRQHFANMKTDEKSVEEPVNSYDNDSNGNIENPDYKSLIKNDFDNMDADDIAETRKMAFDSIKEDFSDRVKGDKNENAKPTINEPDRPKTAAEIYEEKHAIIKRQPKKIEKEEPNPLDPGENLFGSLDAIEKDSQEKSKILYEEQRKIDEAKAEENAIKEQESYNESIEDILSEIEENNIKQGLNMKEDNEDLTEMLDKLEGQKQYATYTPTEEYTGPSDYIINNNTDYEDAVEDILESNDFRIVKKSNSEKNAILDKFTNSGDTVTVPLVNSGIYVTMSGASITEIISMNDLTGTGSELELNKLNILNNHITGSSIGKMRLSQLIKVVSYYDIETLYYALYAASYPNISEISRTCSKCGQEYFINMNTRDILRNPEDFVKEAKDIRDNVTTYEILREKSLLNKEIKKACANGNIIVVMRHPSIESYINTMNNLTQETIRKYSNSMIDIIYSISKIYVRDNGHNYIEIIDPNVIMDVISKVKDANLKYELLDMLEDLRPNALPSYGYKATMCPECGYKDESIPFNMEDLLFTHAQQEDQMATLRWAAKLQKKRQSKKK